MEFETTVKDVIQRTYNVKSFRFPRPSEFEYKPGQFMVITVKQGSVRLKKHFTISSSPTEKDFVEFTKKLTDHPFSVALAALKKGDWAAIDGPYGNFTFEGEFPKVGMLSGGIGITPLRSMCKFCTDKHLDSKITLVYANTKEGDIIFRDHFEEMQKANKNLKLVLTVSEPSEGWKGHTGRINGEMIGMEIPDYGERVFYTCGPPGMVVTMTDLLKGLGLSDKQIRKEDFPGY